MTYLFNDPVDFADEMVEGFVAANGRWVRGVRGGVVRSSPAAAGTVAVVIGGGSGHYPAFAGLVGPGLASGAAMGNLFASPSAQQVHSVATAVENGGGVLLTYGNYAGDVLNFDQAEEQLKADGIECVTVTVTDDVSSAPIGAESRRRGVAGGLVVYKAAGAAAQSGQTLGEVAAVAAKANSRTRTIGVAFSGCTLPGASEPLFSVAPGVMEVGMGIHGEPGLSEAALPTADELAALFLDRLLADVPDGVKAAGSRVLLLLNGLGSVKYEELFVVYRRIAQLAAERGMVVADSQVGEFVTSFEMAGASLTVCWLDEELERLWFAPAASAAFVQVGPSGEFSVPELVEGTGTGKLSVAGPSTSSGTGIGSGTESGSGTDESVALAKRIAEGFALGETAIASAEAELGRLDAIAGDGDHGIGMHRGISAAAKAASSSVKQGAGATLIAAGDAWANKAGGTSGAIWGLILRTVGQQVGNTTVPDGAALAAAITKAADAVAAFGKVSLGDKTLYDVLRPFAESLDASRSWATASDTADRAASATADLLPRIGRARPHAEKSVGVIDPGASSFALLVNAMRPLFDERT